MITTEPDDENVSYEGPQAFPVPGEGAWVDDLYPASQVASWRRDHVSVLVIARLESGSVRDVAQAVDADLRAADH